MALERRSKSTEFRTSSRAGTVAARRAVDVALSSLKEARAGVDDLDILALFNEVLDGLDRLGVALNPPVATDATGRSAMDCHANLSQWARERGEARTALHNEEWRRTHSRAGSLEELREQRLARRRAGS